MPSVMKRKVPAKAFQLDAGACEFSGATQSADNKSRGPIKLTASSGAVFNHCYWGPMVFDVAGMKLAKSRIALDYCHSQNEAVGYADKIDVSGGTLQVSGELISFRPDDKAAEILVRGPAGVPYEASIKFDPFNGLVIEEYQAGDQVEVNGRTEFGPVTVIRNCLLRGVAICLYGADPYTESEFSADDAAEFEVTIHQQKESSMSVATETTAPVKTPDQVRAELVAANAEYVNRFGGELAAKWGPLGEGKPIVECYSEFVARLRAEHESALAAGRTAHDAAVAELQTKLTAAEKRATDAEERIASLSLGEKKSVTGGGEKSSEKKPLTGISPAAAAFAAEFALPKAK